MVGWQTKLAFGVIWLSSVAPLGAQSPTIGRSNRALAVDEVIALPRAVAGPNETGMVNQGLQQLDPLPNMAGAQNAPLGIDPEPPMPGNGMMMTPHGPGSMTPGYPMWDDPATHHADWDYPPQTLDTRMPTPEDGLAGNRQISVTPFPNTHMEAGPLATHQLPWYNKLVDRSPHWALKTASYHSMLGFKRSNGVDKDDAFGWYNSFESGCPFWREKDVGFQFGMVFEPTTFDEMFIGLTGGLFHQAIWPGDGCNDYDRLSWGVVYDLFIETSEGTILGQIRPKMGYAVAPNREIGFWVAAPLQDDQAGNAGGNTKANRFEPSTLATAYMRQTFQGELDWTLLAGYSEDPGDGFAGTYVAYRFSDLGHIVFSGQKNFNNDGYAFYAGVRIDFFPRGDTSMISGDPQNRFRPFLRTVDHVNMQVRKVE